LRKTYTRHLGMSLRGINIRTVSFFNRALKLLEIHPVLSDQILKLSSVRSHIKSSHHLHYFFNILSTVFLNPVQYDPVASYHLKRGCKTILN